MRVLVTGANGFIGRRVAVELESSGAEVHAVSRHTLPLNRRLVWHRCDLLQPGASRRLVDVIRPDCLVHLAWTTTPGRLWSEAVNMAWAAASLELHAAFAEFGGRRAVYAGTCAEYDWTQPDLDEDSPINPATYYGIAKAATSRLILEYPSSPDLSVAWGRVFHLYGPGEKKGRLVSDAIDALLHGRSIKCSSGLQERDFMHVSDVARAFISVLKSDVQGPINIARGKSFRVLDVLGEVGRQIGRPDLLLIGHLNSASHDPALMRTRARRLTNEVGFLPRYDLQTGIAQTIASRLQELSETDVAQANKRLDIVSRVSSQD